MKYLPSENLSFKTELDAATILTRLRDKLETEKPYQFNLFNRGSTKPYRGKIDGWTFTMSRIIRYRNSFLPQISGDIESVSGGSIIRVSMKLHVIVLVFIAIWCGGIALFLIGFTSQSFGTNDFYPGALIALGMLLFVYLMAMFGFKSESSKSKQFLQDLFEAEMVEE